MLVAFIPPHLWPLLILAAVAIFFVVLRLVRKSPEVRQAVEETLGDGTPEKALDDLRTAKEAAGRQADQARADAAQLDDAAAQLDDELGESDDSE